MTKLIVGFCNFANAPKNDRNTFSGLNTEFQYVKPGGSQRNDYALKG
jgi:hypothetical protein